MSVKFCVLCKKEHDDHGWLFRSWDDVDGWACTQYFKPSGSWSMENNITSETYQKRYEASRDLVQPFRDGVPSAEYVKLTGGKNMSKEDIKRAQPVWQDVPGLKGVCNRSDNMIKK